MPRTPPIPLPFAAFLTVAAALVAVSCSVTPSRPVALATGEKIYRQKCADCHGATGQGVADEYADALTGDWALARLTRYVATTMPDDKPGSLTRTEADAVSTYIFDTFYSPAAQARLRPARVALAHLTNRQYAVTVADLLRSLAPAAATETPPADTPRGLAATYFSVAQRGRFDPAKLAHRGTDATVDFIFPENGELRARLTLPPLDRPPTPNSREPAGFSAQWRGTVFADETGDHEFIIHTPNSVRVWINADPEPRGATEPPTLDVNVSTPKNPDHRVTLRLLGGRSYPIAIDWWALPEKTGSPVVPAISLRWKPPHGSERPIPARNLSTAKSAPTFVVATRFPADDASHGYERSTSVSKAWDEATTSAAFEITNHVLKRLDRLAGARPDDPARAKKIATFAEKFTAAAFRRPLSPEETQRYVTTLLRDAPDPDHGLRRVILLALKSPHFLYTELPSLATSPTPATPAAPAPPAPHDIATRLAFALWDSAPDRDLASAAATNRLFTRPEVTAQARRLLADPRARAKLSEFFTQWLQIRYVEDLSKNATLFPSFTPELIDDLRTSLTLFVDDVVWSERSDYRELLRADYLYANDRLATFYNLPPPAPASTLAATPGDFIRVPAPAGQRSGVLTHPYLLAALSYKSTSSPIHRGVFLTRSIVGRALKPPPEAQTFDETTFAPDLTMRQKVEKLTRSENCQGCHAVINPLGFSLEHFDAVGRYRTADNGRPIDAASDYGADELAKPVRLASARDVADFALANAQANEAFIEQLFHHLVKQPAAAYGPDTLARLRDSFIASHYNIQNLLVDIATLAALRGTAPALVAATPPRP
jgi:mono/diheme cytochrome c family protein